jgi:hypothetical protein
MSFLSPEERAGLHSSRFEELTYGSLMPAHETAHQWWGDLLLWNSYREQWLVEGLSNYCALLAVEERNPQVLRPILERYRQDLLERNEAGRVISDAGPVTLGLRLNSSRFPEAYEVIAYERGTWLFHMLHSLLLDARDTPMPVQANLLALRPLLPRFPQAPQRLGQPANPRRRILSLPFYATCGSVLREGKSTPATYNRPSRKPSRNRFATRGASRWSGSLTAG